MKKLNVLFILLITSVIPGKLIAQVAPNPLISAGKTIYASPDKNKEHITDGITKAWGDWECVAGSWWAIEVGSGPDSVMVNFNSRDYSWSDDIAANGSCKAGAAMNFPIDYRFLTSGNSTNGEDGDWEVALTITGNDCTARVHTFPFTGKSWVKMEIISGNSQVCEAGIFDITGHKDDGWFFCGNSITAEVFKSDDQPGDQAFEKLVYKNTNNTNRPMVLRGGIPCIRSEHVVEDLEKYYNYAKDAKYWGILLGTNDAWGGSVNGVQNYKANIQTIIDYLLARGNIPVLAKIPAADESRTGWQIHPDYITAVEDLIEENNIPAGPDFYSWALAHPEELIDGVHPNTAGKISMQQLWAECAVNLYEGTTTTINDKLKQKDISIFTVRRISSNTFELGLQSKAAVNLYALNGKLIDNKQYNAGNHQINCTQKGVVILKVQTQKGIQTEKLVVY